MKRARQFQIMKLNVLTRMEQNSQDKCYVCAIEFKIGDFVHISNGKNPKYYHEDCYGRLLH